MFILNGTSVSPHPSLREYQKRWSRENGRAGERGVVVAWNADFGASQAVAVWNSQLIL